VPRSRCLHTHPPVLLDAARCELYAARRYGLDRLTSQTLHAPMPAMVGTTAATVFAVAATTTEAA
jgi:hypothetical protein